VGLDAAQPERDAIRDVPEETIERTIAKERAWAAASLNYLTPLFL